MFFSFLKYPIALMKKISLFFADPNYKSRGNFALI